VVLAVILIVARRHITAKGPSGDDPTILFRAVPPGLRSDGARRRSSDTDESRRLRFRADPICSTR
jgi:hypothetical protein